jgi:hypothetical protein
MDRCEQPIEQSIDDLNMWSHFFRLEKNGFKIICSSDPQSDYQGQHVSLQKNKHTYLTN